jgi:ketosteroid isomerase-like protein
LDDQAESRRPAVAGGPIIGAYEYAVRRIIELANRGMYAEALQFYLPDAQLHLGGGELAGGYQGRTSINDLIEVAIKQYGQPRVTIDSLHVAGAKVYVETRTQPAGSTGHDAESHELHIFEFSEGKVARHRIFTDAVPPTRFTTPPE